MYRVPFTVTDDQVAFADPIAVEIQFVDKTSEAVEATASRSRSVAVFASRDESRTLKQEDSMDHAKAIRASLGLPEDATDEQVHAALESLKASQSDDGTPNGEPEDDGDESTETEGDESEDEDGDEDEEEDEDDDEEEDEDEDEEDGEQLSAEEQLKNATKEELLGYAKMYKVSTKGKSDSAIRKEVLAAHALFALQALVDVALDRGIPVAHVAHVDGELFGVFGNSNVFLGEHKRALLTV